MKATDKLREKYKTYLGYGANPKMVTPAGHDDINLMILMRLEVE